MVERAFSLSDVPSQPSPVRVAVAALQPVNGSLQDKFGTNAMLGKNPLTGEEEGLLSIRMARSNHSCDGNSFHYYDPILAVRFLIARVEIKAGEEITHTYARIYDPVTGMSAEEMRDVLEKQWGIKCPDNCVCLDREAVEKV